MIKSIYIKDFALIDELEVSFEGGLNILTGQTGAGKSIIVGAMNMILGERADTDVIRQGADKAIAEGIIDVGSESQVKRLLQQNAVEYSSELILRREIRAAGSRAFINDTPVNISVLREVGNFLVDLHGQHDHQLLLKEDNHRGVIDNIEEVEPLLDSYREAYRDMVDLREKLDRLQRQERDLKEKMELFRFQAEELESAGLEPGEEEELRAEMNLLDNAEELDQKAAAILELGNGDEINVMELLNSIKLHLEDLARIEPEFETYLDEISTARISIREMIQFTEQYRNEIEFNPRKLEELRQRQSELNRLRQKYDRTVPEMIEYLGEIQEKLDMAENFDAEIDQLEKQIDGQAELLKERAVALHEKRVSMGERLSGELVDELHKLGIPNVAFEVRVRWMRSEDGWIEVDGRPVACTEDGCDEIRLFISTNKGEEPKPLAKIASGGEISRVMLALKSVVAKKQSLPVMIFDEIDNGISGHISEKVGRTMRTLSDHCQIIAITHQPQIASQAHQHYRVEKVDEGDRTVTRIKALSNNEHIKEVASLMSGDEITQAALKSAQQLIEKNTYSN